MAADSRGTRLNLLAVNATSGSMVPTPAALANEFTLEHGRSACRLSRRGEGLTVRVHCCYTICRYEVYHGAHSTAR